MAQRLQRGVSEGELHRQIPYTKYPGARNKRATDGICGVGKGARGTGWAAGGPAVGGDGKKGGRESEGNRVVERKREMKGEERGIGSPLETRRTACRKGRGSSALLISLAIYKMRSAVVSCTHNNT